MQAAAARASSWARTTAAPRAAARAAGAARPALAARRAAAPPPAALPAGGEPAAPACSSSQSVSSADASSASATGLWLLQRGAFAPPSVAQAGFLLLGAAALAAAGAAPADAAEPAASAAAAAGALNPSFELAEGQEFWSNVARYGRYFVTVMLGTGYVMLKPLGDALRRPGTAILAIAGVSGVLLFMKVTLEMMLGMSASPDYVSMGMDST